jgi:hypothetical protein
VEGFENALIAVGSNEMKSFVLGPQEADGDRDEKLERGVDRKGLQLPFEPFTGQVILFMTPDRQELPAVVKFVNEEVIAADFNHPPAAGSLLLRSRRPKSVRPGAIRGPVVKRRAAVAEIPKIIHKNLVLTSTRKRLIETVHGRVACLMSDLPK